MANDGQQRLALQPVETPITLTAPLSEQTSSTPEAATPALVSDYLDHLTASLLKLPYAEREAIRAEVRLHLLASIAAFEEMGEPSERAIPQALTRFGDPHLLARRFLRSWESTGKNRHRFPGAAMFHAMRLFGVAAPIVLLFLSVLLQVPNPVVDLGSVAFCVLLAIPIWGGWRLSMYRRAASGTFYGLGALATAMVPILIFADLLPPYAANVPYLGAIFAAWTPIATISAAISQQVEARRRRWRLTC